MNCFTYSTQVYDSFSTKATVFGVNSLVVIRIVCLLFRPEGRPVHGNTSAVKVTETFGNISIGDFGEVL